MGRREEREKATA